MEQEIIQKIQEAELVLIGIGEEFDREKLLKRNPEYQEYQEKLNALGKEWVLPELRRQLLKEEEGKATVKKALQNLLKLVEKKNYFIVSVSTNDTLTECGFREDRLVMPLGGSRRKQCESGEHNILELTAEDREQIAACSKAGAWERLTLGNCPECGRPMVFNSVYARNYNENGYLDNWQLYTKWLQGTLNRKLCILELGVCLDYPGVVRFPFEKAGYFNQKADFIRVNERLYQLTEELKGRGISVAENAVEWLAFHTSV